MEMNDIEIKEWLHSMGIYDYDICDGIVHVVGDVDISSCGLGCIPVQFGYVSGDFYCNDNNLESLKGCPSEVGGDFSCRANELDSLIGGPKEVTGEFDCNDNRFSHIKIGGVFEC
jgi:hypothetical protein